MINLKPYKNLFSSEWKSKYGAILMDEHLEKMENHLHQFQKGETLFEFPYFKDEIKEDLTLSFQPFLDALSLNDGNEIVKHLETIPIEHWLMVLGQRLTSASIRDERAIPPAKHILLESCKQPFNSEITMAQRAWEKHIGRTEDTFWGEIKGNNQHKQEKVMEKISEILDNTTWWNAFFHYKHGWVYEVREKDGHGIRWNLEGTQLIGFLEHFINEDYKIKIERKNNQGIIILKVLSLFRDKNLVNTLEEIGEYMKKYETEDEIIINCSQYYIDDIKKNLLDENINFSVYQSTNL